MPYISFGNFQKIRPKSEFENSEKSTILFKTEIDDFPEYILTKDQILEIGVSQKLLTNPNEDIILKYFYKIEQEDNHKFIFEGKKPSFHKSNTCSSLFGSFNNYNIPQEIPNRANKIGGEENEKKAVKFFREWFIQNIATYKEGWKIIYLSLISGLKLFGGRLVMFTK